MTWSIRPIGTQASYIDSDGPSEGLKGWSALNSEHDRGDEQGWKTALTHPWWVGIGSVAAVCAVIIAIAAWLYPVGSDTGSANRTVASEPSPMSTVPQSPSLTAVASPAVASVSAKPSSSSTKPSASAPAIQYLADRYAVAGSPRTGTLKINGKLYPHTVHAKICSNGGPYAFEYDLNREWTALRATIGISDESWADIVVQFEVFADGKPVGVAHRVGLGQEFQFDGDVSGALRLRLVVSKLAASGCGYAGWGDVRVSR